MVIDQMRWLADVGAGIVAGFLSVSTGSLDGVSLRHR